MQDHRNVASTLHNVPVEVMVVLNVSTQGTVLLAAVISGWNDVDVMNLMQCTAVVNWANQGGWLRNKVDNLLADGTHPSTNRTQHKATIFLETDVFPLSIQ